MQSTFTLIVIYLHYPVELNARACCRTSHDLVSPDSSTAPEGAKQLAADEIAERFTGKTVTFVPASGDRKVLVFYGENNELAGKVVEGGDWSGTGYYGVVNDDSICLSWDERDEGRLRCMDVLVKDGAVQKYNADGSLSGNIVEFEDGKTFGS